MPLKKTMPKNNSLTKTRLNVKKNNPHLPLWLTFMIILAIIIIACIIIFYYYQKQLPSQNELLKISTISSENLMPLEVHSYVGKILKIEKDKIAIDALREKNYLEKDSLLTVKINSNTQISKLLIPMTLSGDLEKDKVKREEAKIEDLKVGDEVLVYAQENLKNKIFFAADKIELQSVF